MNTYRESHPAGETVPGPTPTRVDLHCHSTASQIAKLGVQRAVALPECATPPEEVYELAKRRGMTFVTITDHDTIDGALQIADRPDVFVSEELTAWFPGEPQAVHVLCYGITPDDHAWLQAHSQNVFACAEYLHDQDIACALAHPFFHVRAPLGAAHRRTLARLFPVWETRNGSRARELNAPAVVYIETHGGIGVGGSDDHAGTDIGRTYTESPPAADPGEFLEHLRRGRVHPDGTEGSPARLAHGAVALAARTLRASISSEPGELPDPGNVLELAERVLREGHVRDGQVRHRRSAVGGLGPEDLRRLLAAWLSAMELPTDPDPLLAQLQAADFRHGELERQARRIHERKLRQAATQLLAAAPEDLGRDSLALFEACLPAVPYLPAAAFLSRERTKLTARDGDLVRVAVVADGIGNIHGVTHTLAQLRERGVPGYEIDVIGTDASVDRRLPAVAEVELPQYAGLRIGVPSLFALGEALTERPYDLVHVCAPGPAGLGAAMMARVMGLPLVGSYHTELGAYAQARAGDPALEAVVQALTAQFYSHCDLVLAPSRAAEASLRELGVPADRVARWGRGVDIERFSPSHREPGLLDGAFNVLYVGRLSREKGIDLLAEAFLMGREHDPRLRLTLVGRGPEEEELRRRLGENASFLGWLEGQDLARAYASADLFMFASTTETFGQVILEAQASGLPVLAVAAGGATDLIDDGRSGCLVPPEPEAVAEALNRLSTREVLRQRLAAGGVAAAAKRSWARSLEQLAAGYGAALARARPMAPGAPLAPDAEHAA